MSPTADRLTVAVLAATGKQGGATARALLDAGATVRAVVRDPEKAAAKALADAGAELAVADQQDGDALRIAFQGVDRLFMVTVFGERGTDAEVEDGQRIVDAAKAAGVELVVYTSVGGAERDSGVPHFESKRRVERYLEQSGVPHRIVRPVYFMENLVEVPPAVEDGTVVVRLALPDDIPVQMVAVDDIARTAAALLLDPDALTGDAIEIAGDERTGSAVAAAYAVRTGLPARYEELPVEALHDDDVEAMFRWFTHLPAYRADFAGTRRLIGEPLDLDTWLSQQQEVVAR